MKPQILIACAAAMALCACTSPGGEMTAAGRPAPILSGFTPLAAVAPLPSSFCRDAAASDRLRASNVGFDSATLDRITAQSLQQCNQMLAASRIPDYQRVASR